MLQVDHWDKAFFFYYVWEVFKALYYVAVINSSKSRNWSLNASLWAGVQPSFVYKKRVNHFVWITQEFIRKVKDGERYHQPCEKRSSWEVNHQDIVTQVLPQCPSAFVQHVERALGYMTTGDVCRRLFIHQSDSLRISLTNFLLSVWIILVLEECHCFCAENSFWNRLLLFPQRSGILQIRQLVILLNNAKFVQSSSGPHAVCLATEGGIFHFVPSLERAALFFPCFIDTGGSGSLQCVWQCLYRENIDASAQGC